MSGYIVNKPRILSGGHSPLYQHCLLFLNPYLDGITSFFPLFLVSLHDFGPLQVLNILYLSFLIFVFTICKKLVHCYTAVSA